MRLDHPGRDAVSSAVLHPPPGEPDDLPMIRQARRSRSTKGARSIAQKETGGIERGGSKTVTFRTDPGVRQG
jgi:hypothetical protein